MVLETRRLKDEWGKGWFSGTGSSGHDASRIREGGPRASRTIGCVVLVAWCMEDVGRGCVWSSGVVIGARLFKDRGSVLSGRRGAVPRGGVLGAQHLEDGGCGPRGTAARGRRAEGRYLCVPRGTSLGDKDGP